MRLRPVGYEFGRTRRAQSERRPTRWDGGTYPANTAVALLFGGETTVKVKGSGQGGRNQEFALWLLRYLGPDGVWAISAGSAGVDGKSGAAGPALAEDVVFADWSWDSALAHSWIAGFVAEHGFGYDVDHIFADTQPGFLSMHRGDIDVSMETWVNNIQAVWGESTEEGAVIDLGPNFPNAPQGWYVSTRLE